MKYLYYKLYSLCRKIPINSDPEYSAIRILAPVQAMNIIILLALGNYFLKINFYQEVVFIPILVIFAILSYFINYFLFNKNREKILEKYKNESKIKSIIGYILLAIYFLGSAIGVYLISVKLLGRG